MKRVLVSLAAGLCFAAGCASLAGIENNYRAGQHADASGSGGAATGGSSGTGGSAGSNQQDASAGSGGLDGGGVGGSAGSGGASCVDTDAGAMPSTLATVTQAQPGGIAVDCSGVYWTTRGNGTGSIMRLPPGGGTPEQIATGNRPYAIALDANYIYWTDFKADAVKRTDKKTHETLVLAAGGSQGAPSGIAVDNNFVYWTALGSDEIYEMPKASPQENFGLQSIAVNMQPNGIAVDGTHLVWGTSEGVKTVPLAAPDAGAALDAGSSLDSGIALNLDPASAVALGNGYLFWVAYGPDAGAFGWSLADGGGIVRIHGTVVTASPAPPWGIATDGQSAYWTNSYDGTVNKVTPPTSQPIPLASKQDHPAGICVFGNSVYWTNAGTAVDGGHSGNSVGSVMKVHK